MSSRHPTKKKRSGSSNDDTNNSFIKNVTSRISSFMPAPMTKWFGSPSSANANGSAPVAESSDSSTEDEAPEDQINQPLSKKMRYTSPETKSTSTNTEPTETFSIAKTPIGRSSFGPETNFVSTPLNSPNEETIAEPNTSKYNSQNYYSSIGSNSIVRNRKSLYDFQDEEEPEKKEPSSDSVRDLSEPYFKRRIFGSPFYAGKTRYGGASCSDVPNIKHIKTTIVGKSANDDSITVSHATRRVMELLKDYSSPSEPSSDSVRDLSEPYFKQRIFGSPFYAGKTRYGGASCSDVPNIKHIKTTIVGKSANNDSITVSHATRRVMELLKNYSSPLIEAKRISQSAMTSQTTEESFSNTSYKYQELFVPSVATILRLKQRSRLMDSTSAARQIIASNSSSEAFAPYPVSKSRCNESKETQDKLTTKMKVNLTRVSRNDKTLCETTEPAPVHLPTAVLQIDQNNLPKFTLGNSVTTSSDSINISTVETTANATNSTSAAITTASTAPTTVNKIPISATKSMTEGREHIPNIAENTSESQANVFLFSRPVMINVGTMENCTPLPNYTFVSPERQTMEQSKDKNNSTVAQKDTWKCDECWVSNESNADKCVCCGAGKATKSANKAEHSSETWKCDECWVSNKSNVDKCACCGAGKATKSANKPKHTSETWKCDECWVSNESNVDKCVCCGAGKATKSANKPKHSSETWKCDECWVSNESNVDKCVCCGAGKATKSASKSKNCSTCKVAVIQDSFDKCINCENKIDKDGSVTKPIVESKWNCQQCWVNNDKDVDKCVCCGAKNSQEVAPVGNAKFDIASEWICNVCWIKNKSSADKCTVCNGENPTNPTKNKTHPSQPQIDIQASKDSTLKNIKNSQSDKWECPNCLVHNDKNRSLCVCCDTEKPGKTQESDRKSFNFGTIQNIKFKFGIDPNQNIPEKKAESTFAQLKTPVKQSETNNNIVPKPTFTFGIPQQKTSDKILTETVEENQTIAEEPSKPTFTFGESKTIGSSAPVVHNLFSSPINDGSKFPESGTPKSSIETDEKVHEVPNIEEPNTAPPNVTPKPVGLFGLPLNTSSVTTTAPALITFGQTRQFTPTQAVDATATTAIDATVPQSKFSFSGSGKPGLQLFSAVVTTASTTANISFPTVPISSSMSFFQKSEPVRTTSMQLFSETGPVNSTLSLFNKNETMTTSTTVAESALSSAPLFSFGANTQNSQAEKPKFNFTFGKTSEISPVFNMPPANAANILSGNGLPSGNIVNTISGNGLATGLPATTEGSSLSSNTLASGLMGGPVKKDNIMWPSNNEMGAIKMSSENSLQHGGNNLPAIQPGNLFALPAKKENTWALNQNTTLSLKSPSGNTVDPVNNSVGSAQGAIFGAPDKKENMWSLGNNNSNMFAPNAGTNSLQKPATFSFGSSMQFNSNNVTPAPTFGSPAQPQTQNMFGISTQINNNQPAMFSSTLQNQSPPNIFGAQAVNNTASSVGMFGTPNAGANHSFGTPTSLPTFEAAPLNPVTPTFNFGAQQTAGVFGFGQQQAQSQGGVYMFEAQSAAAGPQRQFSIGTAGTASNTMSRRPIRRAFRRTSQR